MTDNIVIDAIVLLQLNNGLKTPFNRIPGQTGIPSHNFYIETEEQWDSYQWNPPGQYPYNVARNGADLQPPDPNASPKPTWQELMNAYTTFTLADRRTICLSLAYETATKRIALLYHPEADFRPEREWQVRLSGGNLSAMDEKREGLKLVYDGLKTRIENATSTIELDAIEADIISDLTWSTEKSNG